ncbi:MAG: FAD-dependent oxidoreductase [Alphaproteobacteria bacterium]
MRIAIIGCGVGGMGAAIALARDGHEINLFDRFDAPAAVGAGLLLQPSGFGSARRAGPAR